MFRTEKKELFYTYAQCSASPEDILARIKAGWDSKDRRVVNYLIGLEKHEDGGDHRHCYIVIDRAYTNKFDIRLFDVDGHHPSMESARNHHAVLAYCAKDGNYVTDIPESAIKKAQELSEKLKKGPKFKDQKRSEISKLLISGELTLSDMVDRYPCQLFYLKNWEQSLLIYKKLTRADPKPLNDLDNYWVWGPPGTGKTRWAETNFGGSMFDKPSDIYWNGYHEQETVLINDVGLDHKDVIWKLKVWSEHRPFNAQCKHGDPIFIRPRRIVVTSNYTISQLLELAGIVDSMLVGALKRRFTEHYIGVVEEEEDLPPKLNSQEIREEKEYLEEFKKFMRDDTY